MPKVSILMTTYNRAKLISIAIDSILAQTFYDWELVIVDDGSDDNTEEVTGKYLKANFPIKFVKNKVNFGITKSRNLALSLCSGEYIAVLDSDDAWTDKDKLKKQVEFLESNSDYVLVGGASDVINESGERIGRLVYREADEAIRKKILLRNQFTHSSVMYRGAVAKKCGGSGDYQVGEDYDLFLKLGLRGKFCNLSEILINYRKHSGGATRDNRFVSAEDHLRIIYKYRGKYPNLWPAVIKACLRVVIYV